MQKNLLTVSNHIPHKGLRTRRGQAHYVLFGFSSAEGQQRLEKLMWDPFGDVKKIFEITDHSQFCNELGYLLVSSGPGERLEHLNKEQLAVACIWMLEAEVNNGGFAQFYSNSSGDYAIQTISALEAVGSSFFLGLARRANALFSDATPPDDRAERNKRMDEWPESADAVLNDLDKNFYKYEEDLHRMVYEYCHRNVERFGI